MNIVELIRSALADTAERDLRNRQRMTILQVMIGNPLMGAVWGLASNAAAWVICFAPTPFEFVIAAGLIAATLAAFDRQSRKMETDVGDASNRGLTRVLGIRWIPSHERPQISWDGEPWRTTIIVMLVLATVANSDATGSTTPLLASNTCLTSLAAGAAVASARGLVSKQTLDGLLRRGTIAT